MGYLNSLSNKINNLEAKDNFKLQELDINLLIPSENNFYGIRELEELKESIKENGLLHNLVVKKKDDGNYEILSGERRYQAMKELGFNKIPCQVREVTDLDGEILLIQANMKTRELNHQEKMQGIKRLQELYKEKKSKGLEVPKGKTRDIIGKEIGLSGVQVGRYMKIDKKLIPEFKEYLSKGNITVTQAEIITSLKEKEQEILFSNIAILDPIESKREISMLIEGIKQPVESKMDKELLKDTFEEVVIETTATKSQLDEEIESLREKIEGKHPRIFIHKEGLITSQFFTQSTVINGTTLEVITSGFSTTNVMTLQIDRVELVDEIKVNRVMTVKGVYRLNDMVYIHIRGDKND